MHKGILGTQNVNRTLQTILNPQEKKLVRGEIAYALGDRVMQIRNNYDLGVFNGDIGYVVDIIDDSECVVDFDGQKSIMNRRTSTNWSTPIASVSTRARGANSRRSSSS